MIDTKAKDIFIAALPRITKTGNKNKLNLKILSLNS